MALAAERQMESLSKMKGALGQYWPLGADVWGGRWWFQISNQNDIAMPAWMVGKDKSATNDIPKCVGGFEGTQTFHFVWVIPVA